MLILVGTMPIAYALNRTLPPEQAPRVAALAEVTETGCSNNSRETSPAILVKC